MPRPPAAETTAWSCEDTLQPGRLLKAELEPAGRGPVAYGHLEPPFEIIFHPLIVGLVPVCNRAMGKIAQIVYFWGSYPTPSFKNSDLERNFLKIVCLFSHNFILSKLLVNIIPLVSKKLEVIINYIPNLPMVPITLNYLVENQSTVPFVLTVRFSIPTPVIHIF